MDYWSGKIPCWEMRDCARIICEKCPAFQDRSRPCWEIEDTLCDKIMGTEKSCQICNVYLKYRNVRMEN
ncbi:MAG: hypothetical protein AB1756_05685 [Acidobacteriota bacterium]